MYDMPQPTTALATDKTLLVLNPADPSTTLRAALGHPETANSDLSLLVIFPTAEYEARRRARYEAGVATPYTIEHLEDEAQRIARRVGEEWLGSADRFEARGAVGRPRDCVCAAVKELAVGRVFIPTSQRTIWQRLFGGLDLPTDLGRVLSTEVSIVSVDGTTDLLPDEFDPEPTVEIIDPDSKD